jgi:hypothetical protein
MAQENANNANIHLLETVPNEIFRIYLQFLSRADILVLDNSMTNHATRPRYLAALNDLHIFEDVDLTIDEARWMMARGASVKILNIEFFEETWLEFVLKFQHRVSSIICEMIDESLLDRIGACSSLKTLSINRSQNISENSLLNFMTLNPQLEMLHLASFSNLSSFEVILPFCRNLRYLEFPNNNWFTDEHVFEIIAARLQFLKMINFSLTLVKNDDTVRALIEGYPNIRSILCQSTLLPFETSEFLLKNVTLRSFMGDDPEFQEMAMAEFVELLNGDNSVLVLDQLISFQIFPRVVELFSRIPVSCSVPLLLL